MALPFKCRILFFCLVLLMCCTSGARNTIKQGSEARDQVYATTYGTGTANGEKEVEVENAHEENPTYVAQYGGVKETNQPYVTSYGRGKETKPPYITSYGGSKETNQPYVTSYGGEKETNQPYISSYKGARETNHPYVTSYRGEKETNQPYITSYGGTGETDHPYITSYGGEKETNRPYITSYGGTGETDHPYVTSNGGEKETNRPYITSYGDEETNLPNIITYGGPKETKPPYITSYRDAEEKNRPYITSYEGTKETNKPYITAYEKAKETNHRPYITGYRSPKAEHPYITGYNDPKETNQPYITAYGDTKKNNHHPYLTGYGNTKADQHPYITGYNDAEETKEHLYISAYGDSKETNERPRFFGNGESQDPRPKCKRHLHAGHNHMMGHANHMHTQPSTGMDHTEAFKIGFFTPDDLYAGKIMPLYFPIKEPSSRFLPREVAESIPFSMSQLPNLLQLFSIPQGSPEAKEMEQTLRECELKPINGEIKLCATSLESMVEFAHSIIGSQVNFNLLSTTHPTLATALTQNYTVSETPKQVLAPKMVFCHPEPYPYAVFFCHFFGTETKVFQVALRGESGDDVEAMAVCHMDTSDWDPNHVLFSLLGVKPGVSSPVCHFLPKNHLVWIPSPTAATA